MLTIRLQRTGKRNQADFRIVLAQKTAAAGKKFVEVLGHYNPRSKAFGIKDEARLQYWIAQHVELSPTLRNLLVSKNLLAGKKVKAFSVPKKSAEPAASTPPVPATTADEPKAEDPKNEPVSGQDTNKTSSGTNSELGITNQALADGKNQKDTAHSTNTINVTNTTDTTNKTD